MNDTPFTKWFETKAIPIMILAFSGMAGTIALFAVLVLAKLTYRIMFGGPCG